MMDFEQTQLLIYQHVVQLTLIDHEVEQAFVLAHHVAALAFDEAFTREGLARAAQKSQGSAAHGVPPAPDPPRASGTGGET